MKPFLTILSGASAGSKHALEPGKRYILGRDDQADICLPEKKISRRHATLVWDAELSQVIVEDLNSLNGTYVNQEVISTPTHLNDGDRVQIGSYLMEVKIPEDSSIVDLISSSISKENSGGLKLTDPLKIDRASEDSLEQTGGRLISGKLDQLNLPDLLQMLSATRKTGRLVISKRKIVSAPHPSVTIGTEIGSLYLNNGELLYVDYNGLVNEEAFFELLQWTEGYFALFPHQHFEFHHVVEMPIEALLLEGFRRIDEKKADHLEIEENDTFEVKLDEPLTQLSAEELEVFQLAWKLKTASKIWQRATRQKEETNKIIGSLIRKGFVIRTTSI